MAKIEGLLGLIYTAESIILLLFLTGPGQLAYFISFLIILISSFKSYKSEYSSQLSLPSIRPSLVNQEQSDKELLEECEKIEGEMFAQECKVAIEKSHERPISFDIKGRRVLGFKQSPEVLVSLLEENGRIENWERRTRKKK